MTEEEKELILGYLDNRLSASQFDSLQALLRQNKDARSFLLDLSTIDTKLDDFSLSVDPETSAPKTIPFSWREYAWSVVACLLVLFLCTSGYFLFSEPKIAMIQSCEDAAWESDLPTTLGSELTSGSLKLRTGLASIQLRSGANLILDGHFYRLPSRELTGQWVCDHGPKQFLFHLRPVPIIWKGESWHNELYAYLLASYLY